MSVRKYRPSRMNYQTLDSKSQVKTHMSIFTVRARGSRLLVSELSAQERDKSTEFD